MEAGLLISGKYRLLRLLGAGSMGSVWAARNELTDRDFAIKFLLPEQSQNADAINRFFLEARACGQIRHSSIVDVYDMGQADDGSPFLVMELLEGEGFDQRLQRIQRLRPVDACRYIALIARGLEEAHTRGLIHRDLKPGNIFFAIDKSGEMYPKVLDFGISKETNPERFDVVKTSTGAVLGSPAYMSPEQASGQLDIDARTDVWALGIILYESLAGELPFDANNYNALMLAIITQPHRPITDFAPATPPRLSALIDKLLAKDRNERVPTAGQLAVELERIYATMTSTPLGLPERVLSLPPQPATTTDQVWLRGSGEKGANRMSPALMIGAVMALVGLAGGGVALASAQDQSKVASASRMGPTVNAIAARAETAYTEAAAEAQAADAEKRLQAANKRADDAAKTAQTAKVNKRASGAPPSGHVQSGNVQSGKAKPSQSAAAPPSGDKSHGGVSHPGF